MLTFEQVNLKTFPWEATHAALPDRTIFQSPAWLNFLIATQKGEPILAVLRNGAQTAGYFTGMVVRKWGVKILGSPFRGWSTSYMGLNLMPGVSKLAALRGLTSFAFEKLRCSHLEVMDRKFTAEDVAECGLDWTPLNGFEVDLSLREEVIFGNVRPSCRQSIRRALRSGVSVEEANDEIFADEYYAQLEDVFAKQQLVPTYDISRVRELIRHIRPTGNLLLLRARDSGGRCIATTICLLMSPTVMYFWGNASWRAHQHLRPNDLLMWEAMLAGKARGMQVMDLGGAGDYKKKFGGRAISVPWARISSRPLISLLRNTAKTFFEFRQRRRGQRRLQTV